MTAPRLRALAWVISWLLPGPFWLKRWLVRKLLKKRRRRP